jgi:energy-coupling factor transporter ATP-binding protein EcfA2
MRTQLGQYCYQFDAVLRPVLAPLTAVVAAIDQAVPGTPGTALRQPLVDVHHLLAQLCDKVVGQQAYLLIFGPLKSGKSTLMNAIAGAYVSEVSSLPAYPCLVFVSAGKQREYVVTRYDGSTTTFATAAVLQEHIHTAHAELAAAIRRAETANVAFEPQEHFPGAIRRVDVKVEATELATTGAVLVDTPGLYTRMRFGYDRMTRDFRNAAACAIFVVKSDTLFLEQVFAEFHQLLDLFSRIFLVVNVDAQKRDVSPEGRLVPSLEQSQPEAVLEAFQTLAMSAPLQQAAAAGKLRIYPVDLLHAASAVLQKKPTAEQPPGFQRFRQDLGDFLASSDYLAAFLRDSLQRACVLLGEGKELATRGDAAQLAAQVADLDERLAFVDSEQKRLQLALQFDWSPVFARLARTLEEETERYARDAGAKLLRTLGASIDTWFLSSHSLDWLCAGQWTPLVQDYRDEVFACARRVLEQAQAQSDGGLDLPDGLSGLLQRCNLDLRALRSQAFANLGKVAWKGNASVAVDIDQIPIKKGVFDVVALRSLDKVRLRLFGSKQKPDQKIPGRDKAARLGEAGRLHLHQRVTQFRAELAPATVSSVLQHLGVQLTKGTIDSLMQQLRAVEPRLAAAKAKLTADRARLQALLTPLQSLAAAATTLVPQLQALGKEFGAEIQAELSNDGPVLQPQPRRSELRGRETRESRTERPERTERRPEPRK